MLSLCQKPTDALSILNITKIHVVPHTDTSKRPEISNQIEKDVPVPSTSNLTLPDLIVIQRRVLSDEEKEVLKKLDQHTEFLPASFIEELLMELKNYSRKTN
nr:1901_t:CDS:2 [Entrophospora candida]